MVISCSALGCRKRQNSLGRNGNKISFHRFPRTKELCQAWLVAAKREDYVPTKYSYLCSDHFADDQFNRARNPNSYRLKPNAIPSIFDGFTPLRKKPQKKVVEKQEPVQEKIFEDNNIKIAPKPPITINNVLPLPKVAFPPNIVTALNAIQQSTTTPVAPGQLNGTPVSIYVVHPQPDGSNIVTMPSTNFGTIPNLNLGNISNANLGTISASNLATIPIPDEGMISAIMAQPAMSDNGETSSDTDFSSSESYCKRIKKYEDRLQHYRREVKILHQRNRRQSLKIQRLQRTIQEIRNADFSDCEKGDFSEDMSEDEIYAELLKHQSESDYEESD